MKKGIFLIGIGTILIVVSIIGLIKKEDTEVKRIIEVNHEEIRPQWI